MKIIKVGSIACPSCIIMDEIFNKIKSKYSFEFCEYDYDFDEEDVKVLNVGKILPVYIVIISGKEVGRIIGEKSEKEFTECLELLISEESV